MQQLQKPISNPRSCLAPGIRSIVLQWLPKDQIRRSPRSPEKADVPPPILEPSIPQQRLSVRARVALNFLPLFVRAPEARLLLGRLLATATRHYHDPRTGVADQLGIAATSWAFDRP